MASGSYFLHGKNLQEEGDQLVEILKNFSSPLTYDQQLWADNWEPPELLYLKPLNFPEYKLTFLLGANGAAYSSFFLHRHKAQYRRWIQLAIDDFLHENRLHINNMNCIASQIRRGDRVLPKDSKETYEQYCNRTEDYEKCSGLVPFGAIELRHVLNHSLPLFPRSSDRRAFKTILLFTEDEEWFDSQLQSLEVENVTLANGHTISLYGKERIRILLFRIRHAYSALHTTGRKVLVNSSMEQTSKNGMREGTASGVHLFASLKLVSHCQGFVGHLGSGATAMFFSRMCVRNHYFQTWGICPPYYDFKTSGL